MSKEPRIEEVSSWAGAVERKPHRVGRPKTANGRPTYQGVEQPSPGAPQFTDPLTHQDESWSSQNSRAEQAVKASRQVPIGTQAPWM